MNSNWSYSPETKSWVVTSVTLTFDLWPWPFAWTLPWSNVITPENFMMIRWWEHSQKGVTDGQTDGQTDVQLRGTMRDFFLSMTLWALKKEQRPCELHISCTDHRTSVGLSHPWPYGPCPQAHTSWTSSLTIHGYITQSSCQFKPTLHRQVVWLCRDTSQSHQVISSPHHMDE